MNWVSDCRNFKIPSHGAFEANKFVIEIRRLVGNFADACRDNFVLPDCERRKYLQTYRQEHQ